MGIQTNTAQSIDQVSSKPQWRSSPKNYPFPATVSSPELPFVDAGISSALDDLTEGKIIQNCCFVSHTKNIFLGVLNGVISESEVLELDSARRKSISFLQLSAKATDNSAGTINFNRCVLSHKVRSQLKKNLTEEFSPVPTVLLPEVLKAASLCDVLSDEDLLSISSPSDAYKVFPNIDSLLEKPFSKASIYAPDFEVSDSGFSVFGSEYMPIDFSSLSDDRIPEALKVLSYKTIALTSSLCSATSIVEDIFEPEYAFEEALTLLTELAGRDGVFSIDELKVLVKSYPSEMRKIFHHLENPDDEDHCLGFLSHLTATKPYWRECEGQNFDSETANNIIDELNSHVDDFPNFRDYISNCVASLTFYISANNLEYSCEMQHDADGEYAPIELMYPILFSPYDAITHELELSFFSGGYCHMGMEYSVSGNQYSAAIMYSSVLAGVVDHLSIMAKSLLLTHE